MIRTVLVDDEPLALARLEDLLAAHREVEIVGSCRDGLSAVEALESLRPDLCFLDIQMPELDGFGVVEALTPEALPCLVFATAYDAYAIQAFEARALDYLLKPFSAARLARCMERVRQSIAGRRALDRHAQIQALVQASPRPTRLVVRHQGRALLLPVDQIEAVEAEANTMWLHRGRDAYAHRATLAALEARLDPARFFRAHRSWLVNLEAIQALESGPGDVLFARTRGNVPVPVAEGRRRELRRRLAQPIGICDGPKG